MPHDGARSLMSSSRRVIAAAHDGDRAWRRLLSPQRELFVIKQFSRTSAARVSKPRETVIACRGRPRVRDRRRAPETDGLRGGHAALAAARWRFAMDHLPRAGRARPPSRRPILGFSFGGLGPRQGTPGPRGEIRNTVGSWRRDGANG